MLRWVIAASVLAGAGPAAAEDWWYFGTDGVAPARQVGMVDADSIDWTDPAIPRVRMALWSETPDEAGIAIGVATYALDCDASKVGMVLIEVRDAAATVLDSEVLTDEPFQAIGPGTYFDLLRAAVCEEQWSWDDAFQYGEGKTLTELSGKVF